MRSTSPSSPMTTARVVQVLVAVMEKRLYIGQEATAEPESTRGSMAKLGVKIVFAGLFMFGFSTEKAELKNVKIAS